MVSKSFSRSKRIVCGTERAVRYAKRCRARGDRREARRNLAGGGDGYTATGRKTGERDIS